MQTVSALSGDRISMTEIINGRAVAKEIENEIKKQIENLRKERGRPPRLALVCVGNSETEIYVKNITKACERVGIEAVPQIFSEAAKEKEIIDFIKVLNADNGTDAIVVHRPLPVPEKNIINAINPRKDAYGYHRLDCACVPHAVLEILKRSGISVNGKHAVVINRNPYHGIPLAELLIKNDATVTVCHTKTFDLAWHTGQADILISAAGRPGLINGNMIKKGAVIIDVGMSRMGGKWVGDVDLESVKAKASAVTPVPGGVGPVAIAIIMKNVVKLFS